MTLTQDTTTAATTTMTVSTAAATRPASRTRRLLTAGMIAGPLFSLAVVVQEATRDGFDPRKHPLSFLSLGDLGWVQVTNFVICGMLAFLGAVGLRRVLRGQRASRWGPILFGTYGISLIWGGVFVADPAFGFPPGTPDGGPAQVSWHGILHGIAPAVAGLGLVAACFVFARRFAEPARRTDKQSGAQGRTGWRWYSIGTAVTYLVLGFAAFPAGDYRLMLAGGILIWVWTGAICHRALTGKL